MIITLTIYYVTPWLTWDRGPYAPNQLVLINLEARRFYFAFIEIWPQEFYYVAGMLVMAGVGLFLITSTVGRAWCGYACPQTVWVDLFLVIERAIEGDRNQRMKLDKAPWSLSKLAKRVLKHGIWILIGVATGGAWIFLFRRCASASERAHPFPGTGHRLWHDRPFDLHHLCVRRADARAGVHLYVPVAAHPGGHARRAFADRHL